MNRHPSLPGIIFAGAGFILLAATMITLWFALRPLNWPSALATVTSSRVLGDQNGMYRAERAFRYSVDGHEHTVVDSSSFSSSSYRLIQSEVAAFPEGSQREIRVHPTNPGKISTTTSFTFGAVLAPAILLALAVVFGGIGVFALRPDFLPSWSLISSASAFPVQVFGWVFVPVGIVFLAIAGYAAREQVQQAKWPVVMARVTKSEVRAGRARGARFTPWIEFNYVVDGREYVTPTLGAVWTSSRGSVEEIVTEYAPGARHAIRHDPGHPEIIRYGRPMSFTSLLLPIGMLIGGLVFLGFGVALPRVFRDR